MLSQATLIQRLLRIPVLSAKPGDGSAIARQLDIALLEAGFTLSKDALNYFSSLDPVISQQQAQFVIEAVRELVGNHVKHNVYFINFPKGVPDTCDFWIKTLIRWFFTGDSRYGRYQHSYEEMLAHHDEFIASGKDRVTVLHLGKSLQEETLALYHLLAESTVPLNSSDLLLLWELAAACLNDPQPESIPVRESRATINAVRMEHDQPIMVTTVTDILRLAAALSHANDGDVTLQKPTHFCNFSGPRRRALMEALNSVIEQHPSQLADIKGYEERWQRLGERLHPNEYIEWYPHACDVFAVARGGKKVQTLAGKVEVAFASGDVSEAATLLVPLPGLFVRSFDRLWRSATSTSEKGLLCTMLKNAAPAVSARVLLSLQEHLTNRTTQGKTRIFTNRAERAWVTPDKLKPIGEIDIVFAIIAEEIARRLPATPRLVVDPAALNVALPLSEKNKASGFAIQPRGSSQIIESDLLRFFVYWKQKSQRTDYDLSAIILNADFHMITQVSWTNLRSFFGGIHSGDLTDATNGATEFIDIDLQKIHLRGGTYLIPQVNVFTGESFAEVESCFFGFMERTPEQQGNPFEPATVRAKSDVRGEGKIALPLIFVKDDKGRWSAKWTHLYLKGSPRFNQVESNHLTTSVIAQSIMDHRFLTLRYLVDLLQWKAEAFSWYEPATVLADPVTFIGLQAPDGLPEGSTVYTLENLLALMPA